jgi:hypothetical protein
MTSRALRSLSQGVNEGIPGQSWYSFLENCWAGLGRTNNVSLVVGSGHYKLLRSYECTQSAKAKFPKQVLKLLGVRAKMICGCLSFTSFVLLFHHFVWFPFRFFVC